MHMYEHLQVKLLGGKPADACDWGYFGLKSCDTELSKL